MKGYRELSATPSLTDGKSGNRKPGCDISSRLNQFIYFNLAFNSKIDRDHC